MDHNRLKFLLNQLQQELKGSRAIDDDTLAMVRKLDEDIDELIENSENQNSPVMDDAIELETRFAAEHPVAERILREFIDNLGKIGI